MTNTAFGSQRFRRALKATGAHRLATPVTHGSFYGHATIAEGGQGTVYLATGDAHALSRVCVIKTFSASAQETADRARRSIRIQLDLLDKASSWPAALLSSDDQIRPTPWVPDILAWDLESQVLWVAQEFRGPNLRRFLENGVEQKADRRSRDRRTRRQVMDWLLSQIADAVEFLHKQGVVHRDLKPDNILVERVESDHMLSESVALCDLDLSKGQSQTTLTQTGRGMGTPGYSAPEQLWLGARDVTEAADVYALGMVAVFLYTGRGPQEVMIGSDLMKMKLDPALAEMLGSKREWVEQALSFRPEERPPVEALQRSIYGPDSQM